MDRGATRHKTYQEIFPALIDANTGSSSVEGFPPIFLPRRRTRRLLPDRRPEWPPDRRCSIALVLLWLLSLALLPQGSEPEMNDLA